MKDKAMRKILSYMMMSAAMIVIGAGTALSGTFDAPLLSTSSTIQHVDEAAPLDPNGCHIGPTGFHCH